MKIYVTNRVSTELNSEKNKNFLNKFKKAVEIIKNSFKNNTIKDNPSIVRLNVNEQPIYSYRLDNLTRLLFTYAKDENGEETITLLDIAIHNSKVEKFVSGSTKN
jgi:Txe/YoeB family toxin of Txe-Axe toxin-antitoxin module